MQNWTLPHLSDYWDSRVDAIDNLSQVLAEVPEAEREAQLSLLSEAVKHHARALSNTDLIKFTIRVLEDLYRGVSKATAMGTATERRYLYYLAATGRPFFAALTERGYVAHYVIDNTWSTLIGPVGTLPFWFDLAGLQYICPQHVACMKFEEGRPFEEWPALIAKYIEAGRQAAGESVRHCHAAGRHFVYLDIDATDLEFAWKLSKEPGVIFVFRQEALVPGSRCVVNTPDQLRPSPASQARIRSAGLPEDAPDIPPSIEELQSLLDGFLHKSREQQQFYRSVLRSLITQHFALLPADADLTAIKGVVIKFHETSWEVLGRRLDDGYATLSEAINAVLDAIALCPRASTLLPSVLDERTRSTMQDPHLRNFGDFPYFPALLKAVRRAEELGAR